MGDGHFYSASTLAKLTSDEPDGGCSEIMQMFPARIALTHLSHSSRQRQAHPAAKSGC
jgi:hypothetical protein